MSRPGVSKSILAATLFVAVAFSVSAEEATPEGFWQGNIVLPFQKLEVMVEIEKQDPSWSARIWVPSQHVRNIGLTDVSIDGSSVSFVIPGPPGDPTFDGTLSEDGQTISGDYSQGGETRTFSLARSPKPAELEVDIYADYTRPGAAGEGLEGAWRALLEVPPHRMRLILTVSRDEAGEFSGAIESPDQGGQVVTANSFRVHEDSVSFHVTAIGATFAGTMNDDGSEITGDWTQGDKLRLTFKRAN